MEDDCNRRYIVETVKVDKIVPKPRIRSRLNGDDMSVSDLSNLKEFKVKYSKSMTKKDIEEFESKWVSKIITSKGKQ